MLGPVVVCDPGSDVPLDDRFSSWQTYWARRDLGWKWPAPPLVSLHANPDLSAARRARVLAMADQ